jgi:hypothetical protein
MFGRNIDFFAVLVIALVMLGFAEVRSWQMPDLDSIHIENAIDIQRCPVSSQVLSNLFSIFH